MSLLCIPDDIEHTMFTHPVDEPFHSEDFGGSISDLGVSDNRIELLDAKNTTLEQLR